MAKLKRYGKNHSRYKGERFVHSLNDRLDLTTYIPLSDLNEGKIGRTWVTYRSLIFQIFKTGEIELCQTKRVYPSPELSLRSDYHTYIQWGQDGKPLDNTKSEKHIFELVELEDLEAVLNDK